MEYVVHISPLLASQNLTQCLNSLKKCGTFQLPGAWVCQGRKLLQEAQTQREWVLPSPAQTSSNPPPHLLGPLGGPDACHGGGTHKWACSSYSCLVLSPTTYTHLALMPLSMLFHQLCLHPSALANSLLVKISADFPDTWQGASLGLPQNSISLLPSLPLLP